MRVCHVIHSMGPGGAEGLLLDLAAVAEDAGLELSVLSLVASRETFYVDRLREMGVPVHSLALGSRWDPRALVRGPRVIERLRPDVIHTHMKHADLVGARAARRTGAPLVSSLHVVDDAPGSLSRWKRWLAGRARARVAARTIAVSEAQRQWYLRSFPVTPSGVVTIHNGVRHHPSIREEHRERLRAELGVTPGALMAVNVSIMRPGKGHDVLLDAVARLPESSPVVVVLVGDGPERMRLQGRTEIDGRIAQRVRFVGYRTDVAEILQAADLMLHPSFADALPTALIQGLAASLPILATTVGGIPEIVSDECGVLLPPGDAGELATQLSGLAGDPARRASMGHASLARFEAMFEASRWASSLRELYDQILREQATGE